MTQTQAHPARFERVWMGDAIPLGGVCCSDALPLATCARAAMRGKTGSEKPQRAAAGPGLKPAARRAAPVGPVGRSSVIQAPHTLSGTALPLPPLAAPPLLERFELPNTARRRMVSTASRQYSALAAASTIRAVAT